MAWISQIRHYIPHKLNTRYYSVKLYRKGYSISSVCIKYKI